MKTHLDIYDVKTLRNTMSMVKIVENDIFVLILNFFFKILAINCTETLGGCSQLVTELSRVSIT